LFAQLADAGGIIARTELDEALSLLDKDQRQIVRRAGITIGVLDIYHPGLLKPGAALWRLALFAAQRGKVMLPLPQAGAVVVTVAGREEQFGVRLAGFRSFGDTLVRIDMIERVARGAHDAIARDEFYGMASPLIVSLGISEALFLDLMRAAGFRQITPKVKASAEAATPEQPAPENEAAVVPAADETTALEPAPHETVADASALEGGADTDAPAAEATEPMPEVLGANWVFRGRQKPRDQDAHNRRAVKRPSGTTPPKNARDGQRKTVGADGDKASRSRTGKPAVPSRFAPRSAEPKLPAGGGAFAGLAALART
jgi:ATP-dependent RNA helicase SUPV3L1/SUV3